MSLKNLPAFFSPRRFILFLPAFYGPKISIFTSKRRRDWSCFIPILIRQRLTLLVTGTDGKPVAQGRVAIRLEAPEPGRFFSTDFPLVEGSRLLDMSLPLRQGRAEWKYLFPIRGQYRLTVEFVAPDGRKSE